MAMRSAGTEARPGGAVHPEDASILQRRVGRGTRLMCSHVNSRILLSALDDQPLLADEALNHHSKIKVRATIYADFRSAYVGNELKAHAL
ncbi:hypothetical protein, partial [Xanthomonas citri]|uniref:hypothetical protein n=1 Tax=Xanthomonas citri TaxID=346 RepID=UPI0030C7E65D